jgi:hypothetical protein
VVWRDLHKNWTPANRRNREKAAFFVGFGSAVEREFWRCEALDKVAGMPYFLDCHDAAG